MTTLRLMPDYAANVPLWGGDIDALDLSPWLLDRLAQWQDDFNANFDASTGWSSSEARERWGELGARLAGELRRALPDGVTLEVDLWPLEELDA